MAFVTTAVNGWTPVLADPILAREVALQLSETTAHFESSIIAYVIMPSHVHALLGVKRVEDLSRLMQAFKSITTSRIVPLMSETERAQFGADRAYRIWRPRFDDLIIWSEKQFRVKLEYVHNNPVRAGLAREAIDFGCSSARGWLLGEEGLIPIDKNWKWQR
jgi:putative transposase